jgi:2-dehydro-3-deoxygluconokinase
MNANNNHNSTKLFVTLGEIMMRLTAPGHSRFTQNNNFNFVFGGSEANVSVSLANFGFRTAHVTRFPEHDLGTAATQWLMKHGVSTDHIQYGPERLGLYFMEQGAMQRSSRIIYDRFDSAFSHIKPGIIDWNMIMKDAAWFHWTGITPAISETAAQVCLEALQAANKHNVSVSGDINYRRNLWQYGKRPSDVMPELIRLTQFIVGGPTDFENCAGISSNTFEEGCKKMISSYTNIKRIASTLREGTTATNNSLSAVIYDKQRVLKSATYELNPIVDRIGTGDAFMAGLIYGWNTFQDDQKTIDFAAAACAWKHTIEGDINLGSVAEIESLQSGENIGKLLR